MSIEAELGQCILQTHNSKKFSRFNGGSLNPITTLWVASGSICSVQDGPVKDKQLQN